MCWFPAGIPVFISSKNSSDFDMVEVYVIESLSNQVWYTGMALNAERRLNEHNAGKSRFTKGHRPWKLIYTEPHKDWAEARPREKYLKTSTGKKWLRGKLLIESQASAGSLSAGADGRDSSPGHLQT